MKKYVARIFDGEFTYIYTTEAEEMIEAEDKIITLHRSKGLRIVSFRVQII